MTVRQKPDEETHRFKVGDEVWVRVRVHAHPTTATTGPLDKENYVVNVPVNGVWGKNYHYASPDALALAPEPVKPLGLEEILNDLEVETAYAEATSGIARHTLALGQIASRLSKAIEAGDTINGYPVEKWIEWKGGDNPLDNKGVRVTVALRGGSYNYCVKPDNLMWEHGGKKIIQDVEIIAFYIHRPLPEYTPPKENG